MELSKQQQAFYDKITSLDFSKILLTGEGGTGKTYVLVKVLEELIKAEFRVLVCAPTHMARMNLVDKFSPEIKHKVENKTVASALKRFGFKTAEGRTAFTSGTNKYLNQYDVIAIDEVSMLSQRDLDKFLDSEAMIICTGDPQQLPVVKQKKADLKIFAKEYEQVHLDEQMRQQGAIYHLAQKSRHKIYVPQPEDMSDDHNLYMLKTEDELVDKYISNIKNDLDDSGSYRIYAHRYLCYSNDEASARNEQIRQSLYGTTDLPYIKDEFIILQETCSLGYNAEVVQITNVVQHDLPAWGVKYYEIFANDSVIKTFSPRDWEQITKEIKGLRATISTTEDKDLKKQCLAQINYIQDTYTKVAYPFCTTIHKSQGQTIDHIYLNTLSIDKATNKRALMYVGLSRASVSLTVIEVPLRLWQKQRQCNRVYKEGRALYESVYHEKYYFLRERHPHPCKSHDDKLYWGWMFKANAMIPIAYWSVLSIWFNK